MSKNTDSKNGIGKSAGRSRSGSNSSSSGGSKSKTITKARVGSNSSATGIKSKPQPQKGSEKANIVLDAGENDYANLLNHTVSNSTGCDCQDDLHSMLLDFMYGLSLKASTSIMVRNYVLF